MSKLMKIVAGVGGVLLLIVVALVFTAKSLITVDRVKALVLPKVEQALHRKVSLGEVQVGLFSGIELHDLSVADRNGGDPLLRIGMVKLRYQLLPLLNKQVVIDEVRIEKPQLVLVRQTDGELNIADLLAKSAKPSAPAPDAATADDGGIGLRVALATVSDGTVSFIDRRISAAAPPRIELTGLTTQFTEFSLQEELPVDLHGMLNGAPFALKGRVNPSGKTVSLAVELQGLDVTTLEPYYRDKLPGQLTSARLNLKNQVEGNAEAMAVRGLVSLHELSLRLEALPQAPLERVTASAAVDLAVIPGQGLLRIARSEYDLNGIKLAADGTLSGLKSAPAADLKVRIPGLDLHTALAALPARS